MLENESGRRTTADHYYKHKACIAYQEQQIYKIFVLMASEAVNNYITKRYERWLDYSLYHCGLAGISDEAQTS